MSGLTLITGPTEYPLTLQEAKSHLRVENEDVNDDAYIMGLVSGCTELIERRTGRALITQTWEAKFDFFPIKNSDAIVLPKPPAISVTSIKYVDDDGATQTWSPALYQTADLAGNTKAGRVRPAFNESYPSTRQVMEAVTVQFVAGYGLKSKVPEIIKSAMFLLIGHFFANREENITGTIAVKLLTGVEDIISPYKMAKF